MRRISLALLLALTACNSQETPDVAGTTPPATVPPSSPSPTVNGGAEGFNDHGSRDVTSMGATVQMTLELGDVFFEPTFITARGGARVDLELDNTGGLPHTFTSDTVQVNEAVDPGKKAEVTFTLPETGTVAFYCRFHRSDGMRGELRIA